MTAFGCNRRLRRAGARRGLEVELSCAKSRPCQMVPPAAPRRDSAALIRCLRLEWGGGGVGEERLHQRIADGPSDKF